MRKSAIKAAVVVCVLLCPFVAKTQFLMDMIDTTKDLGKGVLSIYHKFDHIRISGYMQPQFQAASDSGIISYSGGSFPPSSKSRFMLRRGRIRFDYAVYNKMHQPAMQFVFQFDGTERGVFIRDFWGRIWENKFQMFALTTGMFARPFGYEVNLSSSDREAPERGRMSQILMKTERDLGAMVSFEPRTGNALAKSIKIDAGIFNGQGLTSNFEYDNYKDFIGQVVIKPSRLGSSPLWLSGGASILQGGLSQSGKYRYYTSAGGGKPNMMADSSHTAGSKLPRKYYGVNAQLKLKHGWGATEIRGEYWWGTQTGSKLLSETPANRIIGEHSYIRNFNGAFVTLVQNLVNSNNQLILKYDYYDPNTDVSGTDIQNQSSNFTLADIRYQTFGFGYLHHFNPNLKMVLYYDLVKNEATGLDAYKSDVSDNVFTCRLQFRF